MKHLHIGFTQIHMLQTAVQQGRREGQYWAPKPNHYTVKSLISGFKLFLFVTKCRCFIIIIILCKITIIELWK
jgi:hypothetical protein